MFFECFVDDFKFSSFFSQFAFNISRAEYVFQIDPIFLYDEPVIYDHHCVVNHLLDLFGLASLSFQVSIAQDRAEIGHQFIQLSVEIINFVQDKGVLISGIVGFVLFCGEL